MNTLSRHIEALLIKHNCVIVPNLGGFVAQCMPAAYNAEEGCFNPPYRSVAFNAMLAINDGLLIERYMQYEGLSYADASRLINQHVNTLKNHIAEEEQVELIGVGTLLNNGEGGYKFIPREGGLITPSLYALETAFVKPWEETKVEQRIDSISKSVEETKPTIEESKKDTFEVLQTNSKILQHAPLTEKQVEREQKTIQPKQEAIEPKHNSEENSLKEDKTKQEATIQEPESKEIEQKPIKHKDRFSIRLPKASRNAVNYVAAAAIAIMFYFLIMPSGLLPSDTPYVASVLPVKTETKAQPTSNNSKKAEITKKAEQPKVEVKPRKTEKAKPVVIAPEPKVPTTEFVIVLASAVQQKCAEEYVAQMKAMGLETTRITQSGSMRRVVLGHFSTEQEARTFLRQLNDDEQFASCWVKEMPV